MILQHFLASTSLLGLSAMVAIPSFDTEGEGGEGGGGSVEQLPGGGLRVSPSGDPEEQARKEAEAAGGTAPELKKGQDEGPKLPEGYDSWEAYGKDVAAGKVKPAEAAEGKPQEEKPAEGQAEVDAKLAPYTEEFTKNGTLSAESKAKAAKEFGVTEDMVDAYLAGIQARQEAITAPFYDQAGGKEQHAEFVKWAADGMTKAEQDELNAAYEAGGPGALAVQQKFVDKWKAEGNGKPPADLTREAENGATAPTDVYESWAQVTRDQGKPEYANDPAFRKKVEEKIGRSTNL